MASCADRATAKVRSFGTRGNRDRCRRIGRTARQYFTLQPYGAVLETVTGLPAVASVSAART